MVAASSPMTSARDVTLDLLARRKLRGVREARSPRVDVSSDHLAFHGEVIRRLLGETA